MKESLKKRCELFVSNRDLMKKNFIWENSYMYPLCASIYTAKNMELDALKIKQAKDLIKQNAGLFSNFRGISMIAIATMLSLDSSPDVKFAHAQTVYKLLKNEFFTSSYLPIAAFIIADMAESYDFETIAKRTRRIYDLMKSEHPFLTTSEDCTYAALLALSNKTDSEAVAEMERCYVLLKDKFFSANAVQSLSHALTLGEEASDVKCTRTMDIFNRLKMQGYKYGTGYELATLGVLALASDDVNHIVGNIIEVNEYLESQRGFGAWGIGSKQRMMYAAIMVMNEYAVNEVNTSMNTAALNSVTSLIIAQQAAMTAAIAASSAAAASSASS